MKVIFNNQGTNGYEYFIEISLSNVIYELDSVVGI